MTQAEKAELLRSLHHGERPLVLPNAWDAASGRLVETAGFPVVATGSAAVAASLGYEDHERAPVREMLAAAARICSAVDVPVTVDAESGYGLASDELTELLLETGAVGCNLEDGDHRGGGLVDADLHAKRIASLKSESRVRGVDLVVNARVDVFVVEWGRPPDRADEAIRRGRLYRQAGADCVYPILVGDEDVIRRLVDEIGGPVNVLLRPGGPSLRRLEALGVSRISLGPGLHRVTEASTRAILERLAGGGDPFS